MTPPFTSLGKQVLHGTHHYADACDVIAAEVIAAALNVCEDGQWSPTFGGYVGGWHHWFAWMPVRTFDQRFAWLCWVERRCVQAHDYLHGGPNFWFMYRRAIA